ncbi:MAG: FtsX-like permease family protein, partial [Acidimicrobiales bacterium]
GRKVRADLLSNRSRSLLAIACLAVGTIAVGATHLAGSSANASFAASFAASNPPSAMLQTSPFPEALVEEVLAHPAVAAGEGRRLLPALVVDGDGGRTNVELVAMTDFADNQVSHIDPRSGAWPPDEGELVVERASLGELSGALGDVVTVDASGGPPLELTIVGTAYDAWEMAPTLGGRVRAYVSIDTMAELTGSRELDTLYLRASEDPLDRDQAIAMAAAVRDDVLTPAGVAVRLSAIQDPAVHRADNSMSFMVQILQLLSLFALVIAIALVLNTVAAVLAQQRRQLGVMKAVGATTGHLMSQYLAYVLALSAVALAVAIPLALVAGRFVAGFVAQIGNFDLLPMGVPWSTIAVAVLISTALPVAAVVWSVRRACRTTVQDAISDRGLTTAARGGKAALPLGRPARLAYRNAARSRPRLVLTVLTVALCGGVLVGVLSTGVALGRLTDQVAGYWGYDIELSFTETVDASVATQLLVDDEAVGSVETWFRTQAFVIRDDGTENENLSITASPVGSSSMQPTLLEGRWFATGDDHPIVVNTHLVDEEPDVAVGEPILLDIEGQRRSWQVVGIASTTLVGPVAFVPTEALGDTLGSPGGTNLVTVELVGGADQDEAATRLESAVRSAGLGVGEVQTNTQLRSAIDGLVALVVGPLTAVGVMLAIVAVIGVAGTMTLGVVEQTREIGVLRTLGASSWAVRWLLLRQGLAIAVIGGALGVVTSLPVAWLLGEAISTSLIMTSLPGAFSWTGVAIWVVVALLIGAVGSTRPARVASRLTIRDTLAYE